MSPRLGFAVWGFEVPARISDSRGLRAGLAGGGGRARRGQHGAQSREDGSEARARLGVGGPAFLHERAVLGRHVGRHVRLEPREDLEQHLRACADTCQPPMVIGREAQTAQRVSFPHAHPRLLIGDEVIFHPSCKEGLYLVQVMQRAGHEREFLRLLWHSSFLSLESSAEIINKQINSLLFTGMVK